MHTVRYAVLGSGSSANAYLFQYGDIAFAVDNGFSGREFERRARATGFDLSLLRFIFLTHTHRDHIAGVGTISNRFKVPVVTHHHLDLPRKIAARVSGQLRLEPGRVWEADGLSCVAFPTSHDVPYCVSFRFEIGGRSFCIITDTGYTTEQMGELAAVSNVLFLEANYCPDMLASGPYPEYLKDRIRSNRGHLSNQDAITFLNRVAGVSSSALETAYFCHLSANNNTVDRLTGLVRRELEWGGRWLVCPRGAMQPGVD